MNKLDKKEAEKLWKMLYEKDLFTAEHSRRVSKLARSFAEVLNWTDEEADNLEMAALIHDMGKLKVPDEIFEKIRKGIRITREERAVLKKHTGAADLPIEYDEIPQIVIDALKYHHERFDGSGYPHGIGKEEIPLGVRMISIADYYDTIVVQRAHKTPDKQNPLDEDDAIQILIERTHTRFDPELVVKFIEGVVKKSQ